MKNIFIFLLFSIVFFSSYSNNYSIIDYGAIANDEINDTKSIQQVIDDCAKNGGGTVYFPAGKWLSGTVYLKDNITIYLSNGAIWQGYNDVNAWPYIEPKITSREDRKARRTMIYAYKIKNVKICGEGTFYPGGDYEIFDVSMNPNEDKNYFRPFGIYMVDCKNIIIEGLYMKHSAFWMQRYFYCDNIKISGLTIYNHANKNNDGIDIDGCHDVIIDNCKIDSSDDALVLKSEGLRACEDITITNCILSSHATPLKCGTGSLGGFKRIAISNIVIRPSKSKEMIHSLEAWGGLSGIDLLIVDGGIMEDIVINNVVMDSIETPLFIKLGNRNDTWAGKPETTSGKINNIKISNLIARNSGAISSAITGYPGNYIDNIHLSDIYISVRGSTNISDTISIVRENSEGYPFNRMFDSNLPSYGLYLRHVKNIFLKNVEFNIKKKEVRPAFYLEDAENITFTDIKVDKSKVSQSIISSKNSKNITIDKLIF